MIVKWGRKGLYAGAIAVTFMTPVVAPVSNTINEVQHRPSFKQEVRHITPAVSVAANTLKRVQIRPDVRFEFRHITPVEVEEVAKTRTHIRFAGISERDRIFKDDEELLELITMLASCDVIS